MFVRRLTIAAALPATGLSYASLISTEEAMARVAYAAASRLTLMTPFLSRTSRIQ
jgi:hypothetical protein